MKAARIACLVVMLLLCWACTQPTQQKRHVHRVTLPEGGNVLSLANPTSNFAISTHTIHQIVPGKEDMQWQALEAQWPDVMSHEHAVRGYQQLCADADTPNAQRFIVHNGDLWLITLDPETQKPLLMNLPSKTRTWQIKNLPITRSANQQTIETIPSHDPRLVQQGRQLYLINTHGLWQIEKSAKAINLKPISLLGLNINNIPNSRLPSSFRHYLPASAKRPFELLSVQSDQLMIYKRHVGTKRWAMSFSLPTVDRVIKALPRDDKLVLATPRSIYISDEMAESWTKQDIIPLAANTTITTLEVFTMQDRQGIAFGTSAGDVFISKNEGQTWTKIKNTDPSGRRIHDINIQGDANIIDIATNGQGILRTKDDGATWAPINTGLHATTPHAINVDINGGILLGTNNGLYSLTKLNEPTTWQPLVMDFTTAITTNKLKKNTIAGTASGQLVVIGASASPSYHKVQTEDLENTVRYEPNAGRYRDISSAAVLTFVPGPNRTTFMMHEKGISGFNGEMQFFNQSNLSKRVLKDALTDAKVTSITRVNDELLMLTQSTGLDVPAQLWRSKDDGSTWHNLESLKHKRPELNSSVFLRQNKPHLIHDGVLYKLDPSTLHGTKVKTPWGPQRTLLAFDTRDENQEIALVRTTRGLALYVLSTNENIAPQRLDLTWPKSYALMDTHQWQVFKNNARVYLKRNNAIFSVNLRRTPNEDGESMVMIFGALGIMFIATTGFGLLKIYS